VRHCARQHRAALWGPRLEAIHRRHGERVSKHDGTAAHLALRLAILDTKRGGRRDLRRIFSHDLPHASARQDIHSLTPPQCLTVATPPSLVGMAFVQVACAMRVAA
jgi:hypothetical protein